MNYLLMEMITVVVFHFVSNYTMICYGSMKTVSLISGRIKELLEAQLNVPASRQELRGWVNKNDRNMSDNVIINF